MIYRNRKRRKKGTFMKLKSASDLRSLVLVQADIDLINAGKSHLVDHKKISQRELAERVGVHRSFINHLTAGRSTTCTPDVADRIAEVLNTPVSLLFVENEPPIISLEKKRQASTLAMAG